MSKIYLIRHGQASLGKANYDALSDNGLHQATLLGRYFSQLDISPDLVISGDMQRHQQTAKNVLDELTSLGDKSIRLDPRWNEFDFEALLRAYISEQHPNALKPQTPSEFFSALRKALVAWSKNEIETPLPETWTAFEERVLASLNDLHTEEAKTIFVFSSGGAISMAIKQVLGLSPSGMVDINLQSRNSGVTELFCKDNRAYLSCLNHVAHLSTAEHCHLITHA